MCVHVIMPAVTTYTRNWLWNSIHVAHNYYSWPIMYMFLIHQIKTDYGTFVQIKEHFWRDNRLTIIDHYIGDKHVRLVLDPICLRRYRKDTSLKNISLEHAVQNFYYCPHVTYQAYQDHDKVFFDGPSSPRCPLHPWSRRLSWSTQTHGILLQPTACILLCTQNIHYRFAYIDGSNNLVLLSNP